VVRTCDGVFRTLEEMVCSDRGGEKTKMVWCAVEVLAYRLLNEDPISLTADILRARDDQRSRPP
jgi:hypothetical protein